MPIVSGMSGRGPKDGKASGADNRHERSEHLLLVERAQGDLKMVKQVELTIGVNGVSTYG